MNQNPESRQAIKEAMRTVPQSAHGEPAVWLAGGALAVAVLAIVGMVTLIVYQGGRAFWPDPLARVTGSDGSALLGEIQGQSTVLEGEENAGQKRVLVRTENFKVLGSHGQWLPVEDQYKAEYPEWALLVELLDEGRMVGMPTAFRVQGEVLQTDPEGIWEAYHDNRKQVLERYDAIQNLRNGELADQANTKERIADLEEVNGRYELGFTLEGGDEVFYPLAEIRRLVTPNRISVWKKLGVYWDRWWEFLSENPRHANSQGGIWPAIFGTVIMTLIMSIMVVPFGVLAALYLKEYAKPGFFVSMVRIAVNNLAGVPSIVFGVFGLSFFCYIVGSRVDDVFFSDSLPNPTFGKGGILWASLTLALLTLPVVIVASEEALSAVPQSMREGSYGCGATRWQTIRRVVLPRAMPGIMTGMILAIARGAGEVAPLMLVGAVKMTQDLPVDLTQAPYIFPQRSFMHLGFHIYDLGFQSQDSEAARPMVFATTFLLIGVVVALNLSAIWIRARLRKRFRAAR